MDNYILKIEFGDIAELRKEKYNPLNSENRKCIELEHINKIDGSINGYIDSINQKSIKNIFHKGDVLFGKLRPYLRKYWLAKFDGVCSTEIWVLKPKKEVCSDSQYLFNLVQSHDFLQAASISSGSKMPRADWKYIVNYPLSIVNSFPEQKAIAQILTTWDKAIETQQLLIEKYKLKKKGLMQKLLAPKEDWKEVRLGKIGQVLNGLTYSPKDINKDGVLVLRSSNIQNRKLAFKDNVFVKVPKYTPVKETDILICVRNGSKNLIGKNTIIDKNTEGVAFGAFMSVYRSDYNLFLIHLFDTKYFKKEVYRNLGATINSINGNDLKKFKMPFPSLQTQTKIANILSSADKEIELLEKQLDKLKEQKKGLMQVLLSGKKRVKLEN